MLKYKVGDLLWYNSDIQPNHRLGFRVLEVNQQTDSYNLLVIQEDRKYWTHTPKGTEISFSGDDGLSLMLNRLPKSVKFKNELYA